MARATVPERVEVRMYQVGFGDCFLVSLRYRRPLADGRAERHLLVDFGSSHAPRGQRLDMVAVAGRIAEDCAGKLDVVVVTHRHKDHLSGFANDEAAEVIRRLDPKLIVQPWTEDPKAPADATGPVGPASRRFLAALTAGDRFARELTGALGAGTTTLRSGVLELALDQLRNAEASTRLNRWAAELEGEYLHAGAASRIGQVIPGLGVEVLGPPTVDQFEDVASQRARDPEYWMLYQGLVATGLPGPTPSAAAETDADGNGDGSDGDGNDGDGSDGDDTRHGPALDVAGGLQTVREMGIPPGPARWLADRLRRQQVHSLQRIVRSLDDTLNNTSLNLLFTVGGRRLLFPGDAQIENWRFTLNRWERDRTLKTRLSQVDLYKVGHHGSRNASPRSLVDLWDGERGLVALLSTRSGTHGASRATAVPRATLVAALEQRATVHSTERLPPAGAVAVHADAKGREPFGP